MYVLPYRITLLSKVLISSYSPDQNMTETMDYIPGSTILGVFASKYIYAKQLIHAHEDNDFYEWFLKDNLIFSNAYICEKSINTTPTPLCIQKTKSAWKNTGNIYNIFLSDTEYDTKPLGGYSNINGNKIMQINPKKRISFHHERERSTGSSKEGIMFNYNALLPNQVFAGNVYGSFGNLKKFKDMFGCKFKARIGKSRSAEYGDVEIELLDIDKYNHKTYINNLDDEFSYDNNDESDYDTFDDGLMLVFTSPCILLNNVGMSEPSLNNIRQHLEKIFGQDSFTIQEKSGIIIKQDNVENYVSVWKMKRPMERAITAGSTIYIYFNRYIDDNIKEGIDILMKEGLGERKGEGFGRITVYPMVHEKYYYASLKKSEIIEKPEGYPPGIVQSIFINIVKKAFTEKVRTVAVLEARKFEHIPKNSLLGRLNLMLENSNPKTFKDKIYQLKNIAKKQLESCTEDDKTNLYNYISEWDIEKTLNMLGDMGDYEKLARLAMFDVKTEESFLQFLWNTYLTTFLKELWLRNKVLTREEVKNK